jgi:ABC-2 type transport system permease protein
MHNNIGILLWKEMTEGLRSYRILIWVMVCLFFGILSPLSAYYMPDILAMIGSTQNIALTLTEVTYRDAVDQYVKNFTQIGSIIMIFLAMGSVAGEKADGSLQFLMVRPISFHVILFAKIIALMAMVVLGIGIAALVCALYTQYLFPGFPLTLFIQSNLILLLYLLVIGVMTTSLSAMVSRPVTAGLASLGLWLVFSMLGSLGGAGWYSFTRLASEIIQVIEGFPISLKPFSSAILVILGSIEGALCVLSRWEPSH